jgi:hypothetical protein
VAPLPVRITVEVARNLSYFPPSDFDSIADIQIEALAEFPRLRLPDPNLVAMGVEDEEFFSDLQYKDNAHFSHLMEDYVFMTVSESLRLIRGIHPSVPLVNTVRFRSDIVASRSRPPLWDIYFLVSQPTS